MATVVRYDLQAKYGVTENIFIPLSDGTQLSTRVWLPTDAFGSVGGRLDLAGQTSSGSGMYPAILEYIPYRRRDGTRARDEPMHGFFSGHGYACIRVDMRGSGESTGHLADEYLALEQDDAVEVIAWIARQPWCDGGVGMMGKSWGGFNSLQVAARRPPALKAIIVLGFTDNRFADDIHWKGGCLLNDNFWWGALMQAFLSQPPDPAILGQDAWKARWLAHLDAMPFNAATWTAHQKKDEYWKHGSVSEDYSAIQVPVLMVDGWADSYTNPAFSLLENLSVPCRAIIGPWVHAYPQDGTPSPPMDFLGEATNWWDHWLKGRTSNSAMTGSPKLQVYVEDGMPPCSSKPHCPGRWVGLDAWPAKEVACVTAKPVANGTLGLPVGMVVDGAAAVVSNSDDDAVVLVHTPLNHGLLSGEWMGAGVLGETAADQRIDNGMAVTFTSAPMAADVAILGQPTFTVSLTCDKPKGLLFAQLCDVAPDGAATRITYGLRNLVHCGPAADQGIALLDPAVPVTAVVRFDYCGYTLPAGHRLSLSLANNYWPMVWPSPADTTLQLRLASAALSLPVLTAPEASVIAGPTPIPQKAPPTPITKLTAGRVDRSVSYDIVRDAWTCVTDGVGGVFGEGVYRFDDIDTTIEHNLRRELTLSNRDPLSAHYVITQKFKTSRPGWNTQVDIVSEQRGDVGFLHLRSTMVARLEGEKVFERSWYERIPREAV